jgi:hypothetical protein
MHWVVALEPTETKDNRCIWAVQDEARNVRVEPTQINRHHSPVSNVARRGGTSVC